ncbi:MAG: NUDIX domain-containing protein, partial [Chloroflexi bacterium]|nr:NUDIX domain-containing protein [Chloroflexota bacterium]
MTIPKWLEWARRLESIAQSGLTYTTSPFDVERFEAVRDLAAEIVSEYTHVDLHEILEIYHQQSGYTTPKVDVRGVVFRDGQVLLVQELADGGWTLPGGWVDVNEAPSQAVEREVWEETGYEVKAHKLLALYDREGHDHPPYLFHAYKLFFR